MARSGIPFAAPKSLVGKKIMKLLVLYCFAAVFAGIAVVFRGVTDEFPELFPDDGSTGS